MDKLAWVVVPKWHAFAHVLVDEVRNKHLIPTFVDEDSMKVVKNWTRDPPATSLSAGVSRFYRLRMWSRWKSSRFFAISAVRARPSAGIGVVEVQKLQFFFLRFLRHPRGPLQGSAWSRCKNSSFFWRFLRSARDPLQGSAWSRCKNSRFVAISAVRARPSAGIGVVEVQSCHVTSRLVMPCRVMSCRVMSCLSHGTSRHVATSSLSRLPANAPAGR